MQFLTSLQNADTNVLFSLNGIFIALGACAVIFFGAVSVLKNGRLPPETIFYISPFAVIFGLFFSRMVYVLFSTALFMSWGEAFDFTTGGFCLYGAFFGVALSIVLWCIFTHNKDYILHVTDAACDFAALGICVGRMGSAFSDTCYGRFITSPEFCRFPFACYIEAYESWCLAVYFYEALLCAVIWGLMQYFKPKLQKKGAKTVIFLTLYAGIRTFLESLRADSVYFGFVRISQVISAIILIVIFTLSFIKTVKSERFKRWYIALPVAFLTALTVGFIAEFNMGSASYLRNCIILASSCLILTSLTVWICAIHAGGDCIEAENSDM